MAQSHGTEYTRQSHSDTDETDTTLRCAMILSTHCTESTSRSHSAQTLRSHSSQYSPQIPADTHRLQLRSTHQRCAILVARPRHTWICDTWAAFQRRPPQITARLYSSRPSASPQVLLYSSTICLPPSTAVLSSTICLMLLESHHGQASPGSHQPACTRYRHSSPHALGIVTPARMHSVSSLQPACTRYRHIPSLWTCGRPVESSPPSLEMKVVLYR